jgi:protein NrfC
MTESKKDESNKESVSRRDFLKSGSAAIAAGALGVYASGSTSTALANPDPVEAPSYEPSTGYIVWDSRLCLGCQSCMYACSLTHEGVASPSLSRIQIIRDAPSFTKYPYDITMSVCRQCVTPLCVQNCPTGACHVDTENGNVRVIDPDECIGCGTCIESCPQRPHRTVWNPEKDISMKCDLCLDTPYWSKKGGPDGQQACVSICPAKALKLVSEPPLQTDVNGYDVDLAPPAPPPRNFGDFLKQLTDDNQKEGE